jgi:4-amino-4-deoxy-L-arabinose transferase-like glycosyltransferase
LALFFKVLGTTIVVSRGVLLATGLTTAVLLYLLTRQLYRGPFDVLPALFYIVVGIPIWPANSHHWDSNLFALLALGAFLLWRTRQKARYLVATGALCGLTSCFMQTKGFLAVLALSLLQLWYHRQGDGKRSKAWADLISIPVGYFGVGAVTVIFFWLNGGAIDLFYANIVWPMTNYREVNLVPYGYLLLDVMLPRALSMYRQILPPGISEGMSILSLGPLFVITALPLLILLGVAAISRDRSRRGQVLSSETLPFWVTGTAIWASEMHRPDLVHLVFGSSLLLVMLFFTMKVLYEDSPRSGRMGTLTVIASLVLFSAFTVAQALSATVRLETRRGHIWSFNKDRALEFLDRQVREGDEVFVYPYYSMYYFLANVRNPTRYSVLLYQYNTPDQFSEVINSLEKKKVPYVLSFTEGQFHNLMRGFPNYSDPPNEQQLLERFLATRYRVLDTRSGFTILKRIDPP